MIADRDDDVIYHSCQPLSRLVDIIFPSVKIASMHYFKFNWYSCDCDGGDDDGHGKATLLFRHQIRLKWLFFPFVCWKYMLSIKRVVARVCVCMSYSKHGFCVTKLECLLS